MRVITYVHASSLLAVLALAPPLARATEPWPGDRWRAVVDEIRDGHHLHTTLLGLQAQSERGTIVRLICTDTDLATGHGGTFRATAEAQTRQDDWEGDAGKFGLLVQPMATGCIRSQPRRVRLDR